MLERRTAERVRTLYDEYEPLVLISILWFLVQFLRFAFPPLFGTFQTEYDVSNTETGLLFTSLMMAYAVMQFPAGLISDRIGRSRSIALGAVLFGGVGVAILLAQSFVLLFGLAVLMGATTAGHKTISINMVSNRYPDRTGWCLGILDTVGQFGGVVAPLAAVAFLSSIGWQWTFAVGGLFCLLLAGISETRVRTIPVSSRTREDESEDEAENVRRRYLTLLSDWRLLVFIVVTMAFTFAWNGVSAFLPLYLTAQKGISTQLSSVLYSAFFVVSLSQLITGKVSDSIGQLWVGFGTFTGMVATVAGLLFAEGVLVVSALTLLLGTTFHSFRPVRDSYLMTLIPNDIGGGSLGIIRTGMIVVGATSPAVVGFVADASGFRAAFGVVFVAVSLGGLLTGTLAVLGR
ncbi:MFS transporter [Halobellus salinisoli]|uniref:MFS transporter n=1 Tax=Halobellus salinisoli TaxID=3108500 RepID=UPI0030082343